MTVYCRDCRHRIEYEPGKVTKFDACRLKPKDIPADFVVTGQEVPMVDRYSYCAVQRNSTAENACTAEGKLFEPRDPSL